jgi:hypothetical protein
MLYMKVAFDPDTSCYVEGREEQMINVGVKWQEIDFKTNVVCYE